MATTAVPALRVGVIGIGGFGGAHLRAARESDRIELVTACDSDQYVLDHHHVADPRLDLTPDWRRVCGRADLDAVVVALPHDLYAEVVPALLEARRHVLMEKPLGRTLAEAQRIVDAAARTGRTLMVGGQNKHTPVFGRARRILADGVLGDVFLIRGTTVYRWGHEQEWGWRGDRARSGGVAVLDAGWHMIEQMVAFHGVPERVYAACGTKKGVPGRAYDVDDRVALTFHYADGSIGQMLSCCVTTPGEWRVVVHGSDGSLQVDRREVRLELGGEAPTVEQFDEVDAVRVQLEHFADVVQRGVPSIGGPDAGLKVMRVVDAAYRSMASGEAERT